jgi:hypothetical protein
MRPDKPGYWWWEDHKGRSVIADFDKDMIWRNAFCNCSIDDLEHEATFIKWLGPAHPPKKVKRYAMDTTRRDQMFEIASGAYVQFDDIKEYLLGYEYEKESDD